MTGLVKFEDAPASLKSDMWKNFGFPVPRNEKGGKVTDRQNNIQTLADKDQGATKTLCLLHIMFNLHRLHFPGLLYDNKYRSVDLLHSPDGYVVL